MSEPDRIKRLRIRSWRRGIKEMDLILGRFSDDRLAGLDTESLERFEALLSENDHDLYQWVTGQVPPPPAFATLIETIAAHATARMGGKPDQV
jgi:antitoxin CptB